MSYKNITYILGAGFSSPLGLPIMSNFFDMAKEIYKETTDNSFKSIFNIIKELHAIKSFMNFDLFNIEEVLSLLEMGILTSENRKNRALYIKFIKKVIEYYTPKLNDGIINYGDKRGPEFIFDDNIIINNYGLFISSLLSLQFIKNTKNNNISYKYIDTDNNYNIITLNYDQVIENYINYINSSFNSSKKIFPIHQYEKKYSFSNRLSIKIAKIHGSIDTDIIPPTWSKNVSKYIRNSWRLAYNLLKDSDEIRILGYSLPQTDTYIKYLLGISIKNSIQLKKIDIITLDSDNKVMRQYENIFSPIAKTTRFRFANKNIEKYMNTQRRSIRINIENPNEHGEKQQKIIITCNTNNFEKSHDSFFG